LDSTAACIEAHFVVPVVTEPAPASEGVVVVQVLVIVLLSKEHVVWRVVVPLLVGPVVVVDVVVEYWDAYARHWLPLLPEQPANACTKNTGRQMEKSRDAGTRSTFDMTRHSLF
jgi:hypothetical protein